MDGGKRRWNVNKGRQHAEGCPEPKLGNYQKHMFHDAKASTRTSTLERFLPIIRRSICSTMPWPSPGHRSRTLLSQGSQHPRLTIAQALWLPLLQPQLILSELVSHSLYAAAGNTQGLRQGYTGMSGESSGVLGMQEAIESDSPGLIRLLCS